MKEEPQVKDGAMGIMSPTMRDAEVWTLARMVPWHFLSWCFLWIEGGSLQWAISDPREGQWMGNTGGLESEELSGFIGSGTRSSPMGREEHLQHQVMIGGSSDGYSAVKALG